jgi:hypothetical protein
MAEQKRREVRKKGKMEVEYMRFAVGGNIISEDEREGCMVFGHVRRLLYGSRRAFRPITASNRNDKILNQRRQKDNFRYVNSGLSIPISISPNKKSP